MKNLKQNFVLIAALVFAAFSCTKPSAPAPVVPSPVEKTHPIQIEKDGDVANVNYNTDGTIQSIVSSRGGTIVNNYLFSYENGKIKEINFGGRWKYTYTGNNITKIETYLQNGSLHYSYGFTYAGNKVVEAIEYLSVVGLTPKFKTLFTYRTDGNIEKKEILRFTNNSWFPAEEVYYNEYDQNINVSDEFESFPYLPAQMFSPNNPIKETWTADGVVDQTVQHTYTYDAKGRPKTKSSTFKYPSFPDTFSEIKILY